MTKEEDTSRDSSKDEDEETARVVRSYIVVICGLITILSFFFALTAIRSVPKEFTEGEGLWGELVKLLMLLMK